LQLLRSCRRRQAFASEMTLSKCWLLRRCAVDGGRSGGCACSQRGDAASDVSVEATHDEEEGFVSALLFN
jgi:hypothetical protein